MTLLTALIGALGRAIEQVLRLGRGLGIAAVAFMVAVTILQIICRYGFDHALPWPDEAARFAMLWTTGLMAPTAFRRGGFVAIDALPELMPARVAQALSLLLLVLSLAMLVVGAQIGWSEITGLGGRFASDSLYLPTSFGFDAWYRIPRSWMMASLWVGIVLMLAVNVELILRAVVALLAPSHALPAIPQSDTAGAD